MAKDVRERMVAGATQLLASKGLQATSFSEVIELTHTPRGSIYHHFPGGKDELVQAALDQSCRILVDAVDQVRGQDAAVVLKAVVDGWRTLLVEHDFEVGCAVVAVTVSGSAPQLLESAGRIFGEWCERLADAFMQGGLPAEKAHSFAALTLSTVEGAVVIARAQHATSTYDKATEMLPAILAGMR